MPHPEQRGKDSKPGNETAAIGADARGSVPHAPDPVPGLMALPGAPAAHPPAEAFGTVVGRYKLLQPLGEGGFGTVFLAEQQSPVRRQVAFKVIKLGMDTRQVIARFDAERQALALMDHPGIAKVFDGGITETGRPYFVMELVKGTPITDYCDANNLSVPDRLDLFVQVCRAVQHAHQKGVIHRDLKPSNILVTSHEGKAMPKVIDFGVAKAISTRLTEQTLYTEFRQLIGTPTYMSPEQAEMNAADVDTRADIYSLGVLLYELLTGTTPLDAQALRQAAYEEIHRIIREAEPPRPSTRLSSIGEARDSTPAAPLGSTALQAIARHRRTDPAALRRVLRGDLDWVIMKALEKDRARRYDTAAGFAADVARYLAHEPVTARPPTAAYRLRKFIRKYRAAVATCAALVTLLVLGVVGTTAGMLRARAAVGRAEQSEQDALHQKGVAVTSQAQAEAAARRAAAAAERATALNGFMQSVFASAKPATPGGGRDVKLVDVLERAANQMTTRFRGQPDIEIDARSVLGATYQGLGVKDMAVASYRRAYDIAREHLGPEEPPTLQAGANLAFVMVEIGNAAAAEPLARAVAEAAGRRLPPDDPTMRVALGALSYALQYLRRFSEAEPISRNLVEQARRSGDPDALATNLHNLAMLRLARGDSAEAERLEREAIALREETPGQGDWSSSRALAALGRALINEGKLVEAEPLFRKLIAERRQVLGNQHPDTRGAINSYADLLERLRQYDEAIPLRREQLDAIQDQTSSSYYLARGNLADLLALSGRHAEADPMLAALARHSGSADGYWGEIRRARLLRAVLGTPEQWASPVLFAHAWCALDDLGRDQPTKAFAAGVDNWAGLSFKLARSEPAGQPDISPRDAGGGAVMAGGGLAELRALRDPPPGLYVLGFVIPRPGARTPVRHFAWALVAPWKLDLYPISNEYELADAWAGMLRRGPAESRLEPALALCHRQTPAPGPYRRKEDFAIVATTRVRLPGGSYRVSLTSDDGARAWVDSKPVVDGWTTRSTTTDAADLLLSAGEHEVRVEYFQRGANFKLWFGLAPVGPAATALVTAVGGTADLAHLFDEELAQNYFARGRFLARRGQFREAAAEYTKAVELDPSETTYWLHLASLRAYLGDRDGVAEVRREMLRRFAEPADVDRPYRAAQVAGLLPCPPDELDAASRILDKALVARPATARDPWFCLAKGMVEYRAGRFESALPWLKNAQAPTGAFLEAMAHHRLGRRENARDQLLSHRNRLGMSFAQPGTGDLGTTFNDVLVAYLFLREAEATILGTSEQVQ